MQESPSSAFEIFVAAVYPAWSLMWATLWVLVSFHYGSAALETWRQNGTTWRMRVAEIFDPVIYAVQHFLCHWKWGCKLFGLDPLKFQGDLIPTVSPGNVLRSAITVGSMTPIVFGFAFAFVEVWRGDFWKIVITMVFMLTSILAALGHLFLAHRGSPKLWSRIVVSTLTWIVIGPAIFFAWEKYHG